MSEWLANPDNGSWLLILDNADDATVLLGLSKSATGTVPASRPRRLLDFLPRVPHGAVLITTRDRTCALRLNGHRGTPTEVLSMTLEESIEMFRNVLPEALEEEASELVRELENVPLAISQTSAYIKSVPLVSIPKYLAIFRRSDKDQANLLDKDEGDLRRDPEVPNAVITSWEISFNQIQKNSPDSADLLSLMSYLNRQAIPRFFIQGDVDELAFWDEINPLLSFSLIRPEIGGDTFEMHRLVQTAMRHWLRSEFQDQLWKERTIERVAHHFPTVENQEQHWPICEALMSHADEVLLHQTSSKESSLNRADILVRTAWYLIQRQGHAGLAEQRSTQALQVQRQYLGEDSDEALITLDIVASAYHAGSKLEEARGLWESLLQQRLEKWGSENLDTLDAMHNLAVSYVALGDFENAEVLLECVIEVGERLSSLEDPQFQFSMNALAHLRLRQGKYEEAEKLGIKSLELSSICNGVEHINTLDAMQHLSVAYLSQSKFKEAENMIAQAIPFFAKVFAPSHRKTLNARVYLAIVYYRQGKLEEAEEICVSCLHTEQEVYGSQHKTTLTPQSLLALIYKSQGRLIDASQISRDVVESYKKVFGADHPDTLVTMSNLASCYYKLGEKDQAVQLMTEVLDKRRKVLRAGHPYISDSARTLAIWKGKGEEREGREAEKEGSEEEDSGLCETEEEGSEKEESGQSET